MKRPPAFPAFPSGLDEWLFYDYFDPPVSRPLHPIIEVANRYQTEARIERHAFFRHAHQSKAALRVWAAQEAVVTNSFSQLLLFVSSQIKNVHLRAEFMQVIVGEHHNLKGSTAVNSHPWLLRRLCLSLGLELDRIHPLSCTTKFLNVLSESSSDLLSALGALGVGNERMLIPEYTAVKTCFSSTWPESNYKGFLDANINEDVAHTRIIEKIASSLINSEPEAERYYRGATAGVDARMNYYDELLEHVEKENSQREGRE